MVILISKQFSLTFTFKTIFNTHWSKLFVLFQSCPQITINLNSSLSAQFLLTYFFTSTLISLFYSVTISTSLTFVKLYFIPIPPDLWDTLKRSAKTYVYQTKVIYFFLKPRTLASEITNFKSIKPLTETQMPFFLYKYRIPVIINN